MYEVKAYFHTGFNAVNIPASPSILESAGTSRTFPAVELLQDDGLSFVSVRSTWDEISEVDYVKVGDIYYAVSGSPTMTSADVATIPLLADYLTTAGGAANLSYTDGLVSRMTVQDDSWGAYPEHDDYMAPAEPLMMDVGQYVGDAGASSSYLFIESTIDLPELAKQFNDDGSFSGVGMTFTDEATGATVTVPYTGGDPGHTIFYVNNYSFTSMGTKLYDGNNANIKKALSALRCIGATTSIISQVSVPKTLVTAAITNDGEVTSVTAKVTTEADSGLNPYFSGSSLKKIDYSDFVQYGMITAGGSKMTATPLQVSPTGESPKVSYLSDPRPTGKVYFKFSSLPGSTSGAGFFLSCVDGAEWPSVPLVWREAEGSYQNKISYQLDAKSAATDYKYQQLSADIGQAGQAVGTAFNIASNILGFGFGKQTAKDEAKMGLNNASSGLSGIASIFQSEMDMNNRKSQYAIARQKELQNYAVSQTVIIPQIQCPFNASTLRDFYGNGAFTYRLRYTNTDVARIYLILKRFGYKMTCKLQSGAFAEGPDGFAYVEASGAQVADNIPKRWKDGIAEQISNGVRVWYKHPEAT